MNHIKAIGFDLFNTLITVEPHALDEALSRLTEHLGRCGLDVGFEAFRAVHREEALRFIREAKKDGRETHNRFWISAALHRMEYDVPPDDPVISGAVDAYFSAFLELARPIPGTKEMLGTLKGRYRIGLLSNFTHAPAAEYILDRLDLFPFFDTVVISGAIGYRKPHPVVFRRLSEGLKTPPDQIGYVGDDPECDVVGARQAGLQPIWTTYVKDRNIPFAPGLSAAPIPDPDGGVPRISSWEDLAALLER